MLDFLEPYLHWGPNGLYSTLGLMAIAFAAGWPYAYIAHIGYRKDITKPNPKRTRMALTGGALAAVVVFSLRHVITGDFYRWFATWMDSAPAPVALAFKDYLDQAGFGGFLFATFILLPLAIGLIFLLLVGGLAAFMSGIAVAGAALFSSIGVVLGLLPGFLLGLWVVSYFLFVRLPLQVVYRRAIREGRWPTTAELVWALETGTLGKAGWQSDIMAYKANKFAGSLRAQTKKLHDTFD